VCSKSTSNDGHVCLPVVGHIAIAVEPQAGFEVISESKQLVLQKLQESLSSKTFSDNVAYVGEHNFEESQASPYTQTKAENSRNEEPKQERKSPIVAVLCSLLGVAAVFIALAPIKRRKMHEEARTDPIVHETSQDVLDNPYLDTQNNDCQPDDMAITSSDDSVSEESLGSQNRSTQDVDTAQLINDDGDDGVLQEHTVLNEEVSNWTDNINADEDCCPVSEQEAINDPEINTDRKPMEPPEVVENKSKNSLITDTSNGMDA